MKGSVYVGVYVGVCVMCVGETSCRRDPSSEVWLMLSKRRRRSAPVMFGARIRTKFSNSSRESWPGLSRNSVGAFVSVGGVVSAFGVVVSLTASVVVQQCKGGHGPGPFVHAVTFFVELPISNGGGGELRELLGVCAGRERSRSPWWVLFDLSLVKVDWKTPVCTSVFIRVCTSVYQ